VPGFRRKMSKSPGAGADAGTEAAPGQDHQLEPLQEQKVEQEQTQEQKPLQEQDQTQEQTQDQTHQLKPLQGKPLTMAKSVLSALQAPCTQERLAFLRSHRRHRHGEIGPLNTSLAERLASAYFAQPGCSPVCVANSEPVTRAKAYELLTYTASAIRQLNPALAQKFTDELLGFASMCLVKSAKSRTILDISICLLR
jgi:hypothetical protein